MRTRPPLPAIALASALLVALIVALALTLGGSSGGRAPATGGGAGARAFAGAALPDAPPAPDFLLNDQRGRRVSLSAHRGAVVVLSFLYSGCGANCLLLAQQVRGALDELARPVPVLFVSIDPAFDTAAHVRHFLDQVSLGGRVEYLDDPPQRLRAAWRAYRVATPAQGASAVERSTWVMLIDRRGRERVLFGLEQLTPEALAHDIRTLEAG